MPVNICNPFRKSAPTPNISIKTSDPNDSSSASVISSTPLLGTEECMPTPSTPTDKPTNDKAPDDEQESYKLSVVNGNGVYLPPSPPPERKRPFWRRNSTSNFRLSARQNRPPMEPPSMEEPFATISSESLQSYRRSFDISARSPVSDVTPASSFSRFSLDDGKRRASLEVVNSGSGRVPSRMSIEAVADTAVGMMRGMSLAEEGREGVEEKVPEQGKLNTKTMTMSEEPKKTPAPGRFNLIQRFEKGESRPVASVGRLFGHQGKGGNKVQSTEEQTQVEDPEKIVIERTTSVVVG